MDPIITDYELERSAESQRQNWIDGEALGDTFVALIQSSAGDLTKATEWDDISAHEATFKGYARRLLNGANFGAVAADGDGYKFAVDESVFAYDSGESGDSSNVIRYMVLVADIIGSSHRLRLIARLTGDYTISADGQEVSGVLSNKQQNQPYP